MTSRAHPIPATALSGATSPGSIEMKAIDATRVENAAVAFQPLRKPPEASAPPIDALLHLEQKQQEQPHSWVSRVPIPPRCRAGDKIMIEMVGSPGVLFTIPDVVGTDIVFFVNEKGQVVPKPGDDSTSMVTLAVQVPEYIYGQAPKSTVQVVHPHGGEVSVRLPPGSKSGDTLFLQVPSRRSSTMTADASTKLKGYLAPSANRVYDRRWILLAIFCVIIIIIISIICIAVFASETKTPASQECGEGFYQRAASGAQGGVQMCYQCPPGRNAPLGSTRLADCHQNSSPAPSSIRGGQSGSDSLPSPSPSPSHYVAVEHGRECSSDGRTNFRNIWRKEECEMAAAAMGFRSNANPNEALMADVINTGGAVAGCAHNAITGRLQLNQYQLTVNTDYCGTNGWTCICNKTSSSNGSPASSSGSGVHPGQSSMFKMVDSGNICLMFTPLGVASYTDCISAANQLSLDYSNSNMGQITMVGGNSKQSDPKRKNLPHSCSYSFTEKVLYWNFENAGLPSSACGTNNHRALCICALAPNQCGQCVDYYKATQVACGADVIRTKDACIEAAASVVLDVPLLDTSTVHQVNAAYYPPGCSVYFDNSSPYLLWNSNLESNVIGAPSLCKFS